MVQGWHLSDSCSFSPTSCWTPTQHHRNAHPPQDDRRVKRMLRSSRVSLPVACSQPKTCVDAAQIHFTYSTAPFAFNISRAHMGDVLLTTVGHPLIFEPQFLRIMTALLRIGPRRALGTLPA